MTWRRRAGVRAPKSRYFRGAGAWAFESFGFCLLAS